MIYFLLLLSGIQAFAQVSYFIGKRTDLAKDEKMEFKMAGTLTLDKGFRRWDIVRCVTTANSCASYHYKLFKDKDEKYVLEMPGMQGKYIRIPAKVEDDHVSLRTFKATTFDPKIQNPLYSIEHLTVGQNTMWRAISKTHEGEVIEMKTVLEPVEKKAYDEFIKTKKIEPVKVKPFE